MNAPDHLVVPLSVSKGEHLKISRRWKIWMPYAHLNVFAHSSLSRTPRIGSSTVAAPIAAPKPTLESLRQRHAVILCRLMKSRVSWDMIKRYNLDNPFRPDDEREDLIRTCVQRSIENRRDGYHNADKRGL